MKLLFVLLMVAQNAAQPQDMSGKMFTFPLQTNTAYVKLNTTQQELNSVTVCHRSFTDLKRDHILFSLATPSNSNGFLIFWDGTNQEIEPHVRDRKAEYRGFDYKPNMWHSICTTWNSESGLVQVWFDGQPSIRKFVISSSKIAGPFITILGQDQDTHGGGFDVKQSFVGMMTDVYMWDYTLSSCEMQNFMDEQSFTPGNVLNWRALEFEIKGQVVIEQRLTLCH